ncbi:AAA family ATPase [Thermoflexus hugenholtzii]
MGVSFEWPFAVARRPARLIGREREMEDIRQVLHPPDDRLRIVIIRGPGGVGKTRLLEEIRRELEIRGEFPAAHVACSELVDLIDPWLHLRMGFIRALRESLRWIQRFSPEFNFTNYELAWERYERQVLDSVEYRLIQQAAREAIRAFWEDYERLTERWRIVWLIDTVEQLALSGSHWFLENGLLSEKQVQFQTTSWLLEAIRDRRLKNTTLILSGRSTEGRPFFEQIHRAARENNVPVVDLELGPLRPDGVRAFLNALAEEWDPTGLPEPERKRTDQIREALRWLTKDEERVRRLHRLTEGQPVRLALITDLIVEGRSFPEALREALDRDLPDEDLPRRRWEIEGRIVELLFLWPRPERPLSPEEYAEWSREAFLRQRILLALIRVPMGLSPEQLHYLLDNEKAVPPEEWEKQADPLRIRRIRETMEKLQDLVLIKRRPPRLVIHNGEAYEEIRLGLQDEVYRIFAEHMAPHIAIGQPVDEADRQDRERLKRIWETLSDDERQHYQKNYEDELRERQRIYAMLRDWVAWQVKRVRGAHFHMILQEEREMELELYRMGPGHPLAARLRESEEVRERQIRYRRTLRELELEHMYYALLLNPDRELNETYFDLADEFWRANDEDADMAAQELMWRVLNDRFAMRFVNWGEPREAVRRRQEDTLDTLRRAARQEMASRWIKRFALRRDYTAAQEFAERLEDFIRKGLQGHDRRSWEHTFAQGERLCWKAYARILPGSAEEIRKAIRELDEVLKDMKQLAGRRMGEIALAERGEEGFIGHPAEVRLRRVISVSLANIAYGYAQLGEFEEAIRFYSQALDYIRETGAHAHRATILNNMARAIAELGRSDALRIALDALSLRWQIGADAPIGLSHSTLALIYNRLDRPDRAWVEAAKAMMLFQRVGDPRGRGLAAIQLGEALRRLGVWARTGQTLPATSEELFEAAQRALGEALEIFILREPSPEEGKVLEPLRHLEAKLERGRLFRDRLIGVPRGSWIREGKRWYSAALGTLEEVAQQAQESGWHRLELEALTELAWTHYWAAREASLEEREEALRRAQEAIERARSRLSEARKGPYTAHSAVHIALVRARIALDSFQRWVEQEKAAWESRKGKRPWIDPKAIRREIRTRIGEEIRRDPHGLREAIEAILEGLGELRRLGTCASMRTAFFDVLYDYFKRFNQDELEGLRHWLEQHPTSPEKEEFLRFLKESIGLQS